MIREIVKDIDELSKPCRTVLKKDDDIKQIIQDLVDTAEFHKEKSGCVGLASNQIGYDKKVIVVYIDDKWIPMVNPIITSHSRLQEVFEEGCLSLEGTRNVVRWLGVEVKYLDINGKGKKAILKGFPAFIVQHECDHLKGKLI